MGNIIYMTLFLHILAIHDQIDSNHNLIKNTCKTFHLEFMASLTIKNKNGKTPKSENHSLIFRHDMIVTNKIKRITIKMPKGTNRM